MEKLTKLHQTPSVSAYRTDFLTLVEIQIKINLLRNFYLYLRLKFDYNFSYVCKLEYCCKRPSTELRRRKDMLFC